MSEIQCIRDRVYDALVGDTNQVVSAFHAVVGALEDPPDACDEPHDRSLAEQVHVVSWYICHGTCCQH